MLSKALAFGRVIKIPVQLELGCRAEKETRDTSGEGIWDSNQKGCGTATVGDLDINQNAHTNKGTGSTTVPSEDSLAEAREQ